MTSTTPLAVMAVAGVAAIISYQHAYELALGATAAAHAPWYIVPADSKSHRNLMVMQILLGVLGQLDPAYPPGPASLVGLHVD